MFIETHAVLSGENTVKSHFHSYQPELIQNNAAGALLQWVENHPPTYQKKRKRKHLEHDCCFYHHSFFSIYLPACLAYLCLHHLLSIFPSSSAPAITHHPLIERKGPVLSTTSEIYKILSAVNTCLQIFSPINDSCIFASDGRIHILVYLFDAL